MGSDTILALHCPFLRLRCSRMARLPRYVIPGQPQHIIQHGNNRQVIFAAESDYRFFRDALVEAVSLG